MLIDGFVVVTKERQVPTTCFRRTSSRGLSLLVTLWLASTAHAAQWPGNLPEQFPALEPLAPPRAPVGRAFAWNDSLFAELRAVMGEPIQLIWSRINGGLGIVSWRPKQEVAGKPEDVAREFVSRWRRLFAVSDVAELSAPETTTYIGAFSRVTFHQLYKGVAGQTRVHGARIDVYLTPRNAIWHVVNDYVPKVFVMHAPKVEKSDQCIASVYRTLKLAKPGEAPAPSGLRVLPLASGDVYVQQLVFPTIAPFGTWEVLARATDCGVVRIRDLVRYSDPQGIVFDPNPVIGTQPPPQPGQDVTPLLKSRPLTDLSSSDVLTGKYADTISTQKRARSANRQFNYKPPSSEFAETMAYFHVSRALEMFVPLLPRKAGKPFELPVKINAAGVCKKVGLSCWVPGSREIILGQAVKGIADAEDAHVIVHELGHAILGHLADEAEGPIAKALGEGFSDYLAARVWASTQGESRCFAPWIAARDGKGNCLRLVEQPKDAVRDWQNPQAPWLYAPIWSSTLWDFRQLLLDTSFKLGKNEIDAIIFKAHAALTPRVTFYTPAANAHQEVLKSGNEKAAYTVWKFFADRGLMTVER